MALEKQITLLIGCIETLFYGGTIFGWPSLVFVLKDIGYYAEDCLMISDNVTTSASPVSSPSSNEDHGFIDDESLANSSSILSCPSQDSSLQLVFSVAIAFQLFCFFPVGVLFDILGTRFTRLLMSVLLLGGNLIMGFSSPELPGLLYPGTILFVAGGTAIIVSNMEIGNLFPTHKSTAITAFQGLYGSAQIVVKVAYEAGFSMYTFFFISAGCTLLLNINTFLFLPVHHIPWPLPHGYKLVKRCISPSKTPPTTVPDLDNKAYVVHGEETEVRSLSGIHKGDPNTIEVGESKLTSEIKNHSSAKQTPSPSPPAPDLPEWAEYTSLRACILSSEFWAILVWQAILELDVIYTLGVFNYLLTRLADGDMEVVSSYTNVFIITQLTAVVLGPLAGLVAERNKSGPCKQGHKIRSHYDDILDCCLPLALPSLLSAAYSGVFLIPYLEIHYLAYILITFFRVFFFGTGPVVIASIFPQKYFGRIYGIIRTITGFVTLLQYPIFILIQEYLDNDPFYVMIGFVVADLLTLFLPVFLYITTKSKMTRSDNANENEKQHNK